MLVALAAEVGDALAAQEGEVTLYSGLHGANAEITVVLVVLLTVEDDGAKRLYIEISGDSRQIFIRNGGCDGGPAAIVEGLPQGEIIHMVELDTSFDELGDDLGEGSASGEGGIGCGGDEISIHRKRVSEVCGSPKNGLPQM